MSTNASSGAGNSSGSTPPAPTASVPAQAVQPGFGIDRLLHLLPHRYPFLLLDRVLEISHLTIVAVKNVTINEPFFQGHFPGRPVMPGVLIIEAMAQAGCVMINNRTDEKRVLYLAGIEKTRFKHPVYPGDMLEMHVRSVRERGKLGWAEAKAIVAGRVVTEAELLFVAAD